VDFYENLLKIDLTGNSIWTYGSGDTFYEKFLQIIDGLYRSNLNVLGAIEGAQSVKVAWIPTRGCFESLKTFAKRH